MASPVTPIDNLILQRTENGRVYQWSFASRKGDVVKGMVALYPVGAAAPARTEAEETSLVRSRLKNLAAEFHGAVTAAS